MSKLFSNGEEWYRTEWQLWNCLYIQWLLFISYPIPLFLNPRWWDRSISYWTMGIPIFILFTLMLTQQWSRSKYYRLNLNPLASTLFLPLPTNALMTSPSAFDTNWKVHFLWKVHFYHASKPQGLSQSIKKALITTLKITVIQFRSPIP